MHRNHAHAIELIVVVYTVNPYDAAATVLLHGEDAILLRASLS